MCLFISYIQEVQWFLETPNASQITMQYAVYIKKEQANRHKKKRKGFRLPSFLCFYLFNYQKLNHNAIISKKKERVYYA